MTPEPFIGGARARRRRSSCTTTSSPTDYAPFAEQRARVRGAARRRARQRRERARELMDAVRGELVYDPGATDVQTRADEVLALGRGVCQDFAHVLLAACRCVGIPARYVSGYLYDPTLAGRQRRLARVGRRLGRARRAGSRSTRRTTASRPRPTCASPSGATTPTCRRRAASTRARRSETLVGARRPPGAVTTERKTAGMARYATDDPLAAPAGRGVRLHGRLLERALLGSEREPRRGAQDDGPDRASARRSPLVARFAGRDVELTYTIVAFEPPARVVLEARRGFVSRDTITVAAAGGGSLVRYDAVLTFSGVGRLFEPAHAARLRPRRREGQGRPRGRAQPARRSR